MESAARSTAELLCLSPLSRNMSGPRLAVIQALEDTLAASDNVVSAHTASEKTPSSKAKQKANKSRKKRRAAEEKWILDRLHQEKRSLPEASQAVASSPGSTTTCWNAPSSQPTLDPVGTMGILKLRRLLRETGLPTIGTQRAVLADRLRAAVSSGQLESYVTEARAASAESFQCVVQMRRAKAMLSLVESLIASPSSSGKITTAISSATPKTTAATPLASIGSPTATRGARDAKNANADTEHATETATVKRARSADPMAKAAEAADLEEETRPIDATHSGRDPEDSGAVDSTVPESTKRVAAPSVATTATATTPSSTSNVAVECPNFQTTSLPVKALCAVFSSSVPPKASNQAGPALLVGARGAREKVPAADKANALAPPVVGSQRGSATAAKAAERNTASRSVAEKNGSSAVVQLSSGVIAACPDVSPTSFVSPSSSAFPVRALPPSPVASSRPKNTVMSVAKARETAEPSATIGTGTSIKTPTLKKVFAGNRTQQLGGNGRAAWAPLTASSTASVTVVSTRVTPLPKKKAGGGRVAALVGAFDAKVKKAAPATVPLSKSMVQAGKRVPAKHAPQLAMAGNTAAAVKETAVNGYKLEPKSHLSASGSREEQQTHHQKDLTKNDSKGDSIAAKGSGSKPREDAFEKTASPVLIVPTVVSTATTTQNKKAVPIPSRTIVPKSNKDTGKKSPSTSDSEKSDSSRPKLRNSPSKLTSTTASTSTTATKPAKAGTPQRGWGPPKATPLVKSTSAPCSPTPSTTSTATLTPTAPRSPVSPVTMSKVPVSPSSSASLSPKGNAGATATPTPSSGKSKWGPPRVTPLLVKSISYTVPSSHSPTANTPEDCRKIPSSAKGTSKTNTVSTAKGGTISTTTSKSTISSSRTVTANAPKKPLTAKSGKVETVKRSPPSSGPAQTVPPRSNIATLPPSSQATSIAVVATAEAPSSPKSPPSAYNPLLPSQPAGGCLTPKTGVPAPSGAKAHVVFSASSKGVAPATNGFSTSGPKLPAPPKIMMATSTVSTAAMLQATPAYTGKDIHVFYGHEEEASDNEEGDEGRESDDEYHVNDADSSGSEGDEDDDPALKILEPTITPEWAKGKAVAEALERQYGGEKPVNPNHIFVDFFTCNLEMIFETKKKKWNRNSTGDWMTDRLTIAEQLAYDRAMGYVTIEQNNNGRRAIGSRSKGSPQRSRSKY